ncbi:hypothetical protein RMCBS344292_09184 [Rhizopus microsporus]|nr:hypothetical protein RMCBS344292_09184 [Rhizopus microsporus]
MQKYWAEMEQEKVYTSNIENVEKNSHASSFVAKERNQQNEFTRSTAERKLVRKINYTFMPFVVFIIFIQFVDKSTLSVAGVYSLFQDTHIDRSQFSWLGSIFYLGYLCMQPINSYLLQRLPTAQYVGTVLILWGACLACTSLAKNFSQLAALRFLLGFFEAITYPSMFLLISTFYRRSEQVLWFGVMFMSNGLAGILGSIIGYAIGYMPTVGDISPWKWNMIIFGSLTALTGIIFFFFLPDTPYSRWFRLSGEECSIVEERIRDNAVVRTFHVNYSHIKEALLEPRLYCYCLISLLVNLQNGALTTFSALIISDLGFSSGNSVLLNIPGGAVSIILVACLITISRRYNEIIYVAMVACTISMAGVICLAAIPGGGVKLIGLYLSWACNPAYILLQTSISSNVSGYTKKIFYTSCNIVFYTFGNFIGPLMLVQKEAPRYISGLSGYAAANALCIILYGYVRYTYVKENKKRNLDPRSDNVALPDELEDLTDVENKHFTYRT